jgi:hypothetical protein
MAALSLSMTTGALSTSQISRANLVRRWHNEVERHRALVVHEVVDGEIARRGILRNERIAVERESGFRRGKNAAEVAILLLQHLLRLFPNDGMGERSVASRHAPVVYIPRIVLEVQQFLERLAEAGAGARKHVRQIDETGHVAFERPS